MFAGQRTVGGDENLSAGIRATSTRRSSTKCGSCGGASRRFFAFGREWIPSHSCVSISAITWLRPPE
jgi:hypothetical protein